MSLSSQTRLAAHPTSPPAIQPWVHLAAGAAGGIATCILTSPLDVLRTRLQSGLYQQHAPRAQLPSPGRRSPRLQLLAAPLRHMHETFQILVAIPKHEGWRALFRGLGPGLAGIVPAAAVKFYVYGNGKQLAARGLGRPEQDPVVHAAAAVAAGVATATATNPLWLIKTRLQLDQARGGGQPGASPRPRQYAGALDCLRQVLRAKGVAGLYKGLSASYLGTVETVLHLVLYERLKHALGPARRPRPPGVRHGARDELQAWAATSGAAGLAKVAAVLLTYPHEVRRSHPAAIPPSPANSQVVRTRLRQAPSSGPAYTGLVQCFCSVWQHEGWRGLYGGLTPHLARSIPSAIVTFSVYEGVLRLAGPRPAVV